MAVILLILKIIGIILLVLVGVILLLAMIVLFVPVRYRISGHIEDEMIVHAKVSWLLHAISFCIDYQEKEFQSDIYLLGFRMKKKKKNALDDTDDEAETDDDATEDIIEQRNMEESTNESVDTTDNSLIADINTDKSDMDSLQIDDVDVEASNIFKKIFKTIESKIQSFFKLLHRIRTVIPRFFEKVSSAKNKWKEIADKEVILSLLAELKYLLMHFKFRKLVIDMRFSAGDPAKTGQALGALCMLPFLYKYQVNVVPDFESEDTYVKGDFYVKGHMRVLHVLVSLVRLWKKKEIRMWIKKLLDE